MHLCFECGVLAVSKSSSWPALAILMQILCPFKSFLHPHHPPPPHQSNEVMHNLNNFPASFIYLFFPIFLFPTNPLFLSFSFFPPTPKIPIIVPPALTSSVFFKFFFSSSFYHATSSYAGV